MKEIRLGARLSAYSKVDALTCEACEIEEMTRCDVDKLFGEDCPECSNTTSTTKSNEVSRADIDALFR